MATLLIHHKVADFAVWKKAFDAHEPVRLSAGLSNARLYKSADDEKEVFVVLDCSDVGRAKTFAASAELKEAMANAGVVATPHVHFLTAAD